MQFSRNCIAYFIFSLRDNNQFDICHPQKRIRFHRGARRWCCIVLHSSEKKPWKHLEISFFYYLFIFFVQVKRCTKFVPKSNQHSTLFCSTNWNWFYNFSAIRFTLSHIGNVPSTLIIGQHIVDSQSLTKFSSLDAQKLWNDLICS